MKTLITLFIPLITLTGCHQSVDENDIALGSLYCKSKGTELKRIHAFFDGSEKVYCKNNESIFLSALTPEEINKMKTD